MPTIFVLIPPPLPEKSALETVLAPFAPVSSNKDDDETQTQTATSPASTPRLNIQTTRIPLQPPINLRQAEQWSRDLWPVTFNPAAQRGMVVPPPHILRSARDSIQPRAGRYLALARRVAQEAITSGRGRGVGAVVVDPEIEINDDEDWMSGVVAVAGDARYARREGGQPSLWESSIAANGPGPNPACKKYDPDLEGGPELHALMRAVDMVASRRRADDFEDTPAGLLSSSLAPDLTPLERHFLYSPLTAARSTQKKQQQQEEKEEERPCPSDNPPSSTSSPDPKPTTSTSRILTRSQGGYLCTGLDVYITHEPCLSCCMGMLLSRFRAVVFPRRGRMVTGGLASEPVVSPVRDPNHDDSEEEEGEEEEPGTGETTPKESGERKPETRGENERNYYGLHWRKELNWRALGFEFVEDPHSVEDDDEYNKKLEEDLKVEVAFHA